MAQHDSTERVINSTIIDVSYTQEEMFKKADELKHNFYLAYDVELQDKKDQKTRIVKQYTSYKNKKEFLDKYVNFKSEDKVFYEIKRTEKPRYESYDLEVETKSSVAPPSSEEVIKHFKEYCYPQDNKKLNCKGEEPHFLITEANNNTKTSLHLVNKKRIFDNCEDEKTWVNTNIRMSNIYKNFPDTSVNVSKNRCMRMIYSTKIGKNRPFVAYKDNLDVPIEDFMITDVEFKKYCAYKEKVEQKKEESQKVPLIAQSAELKIEGENVNDNKKKDQSKRKELCSLVDHLVYAIKNNKIKEFFDRGGDGVLQHDDCMKLFCAIVYEGVTKKVKWDDLGDKIADLYRKKTEIDMEREKNSWIDSVLKRIREKRRTVTISTLYKYANMSGYLSLKYMELLENATYGGHFDLAKIFKMATKKNPFINTWESGDKYHGYQWDEDSALYLPRYKSEIINKIQNTLIPIVRKFISKVIEDCKDEDKEVQTKKKKAVGALLINLKNEPYVRNVYECYSRMVQDIDFKKKLNNVGSWELPIRNRKMIDQRTLVQRNRTPNDYYTYFIDRELVSDTSEANKYFLEVLDTPEKVKCFLQYTGYAISPSMRLKKIMIAIGGKDAGKSTLFLILAKVFTTNIISSLSDKVFFNRKSESVHNEEFMKVKDIRVGVVSEPELKSATLSGEKIKSFVGNDLVDVRHCGGRLETLRNTCKAFILTNNAPTLPSDDAVSDKLIFCDCNNHFAKTKANEMKINHHLEDDRFKDEVFTLVLTEGMNLYNNETLTIPECMLTATESYITRSDGVANFISEKIRKMPEDDEKAYIRMPTLYPEYKYFCESNKFVVEQKHSFLDQFRRRLGTKERNKKVDGKVFSAFIGYKIIDDADNDNENDDRNDDNSDNSNISLLNKK